MTYTISQVPYLRDKFAVTTMAIKMEKFSHFFSKEGTSSFFFKSFLLIKDAL